MEESEVLRGASGFDDAEDLSDDSDDDAVITSCGVNGRKHSSDTSSFSSSSLRACIHWSHEDHLPENALRCYRILEVRRHND